MKEQNLRTKLEETLKKQRKEARKNKWKEGGRSIADCFNELTPNYYSYFIISLNKNQFLELMSEISEVRNDWLWNCMSISAINCLYSNLNDLEVFFKHMPITIAQKFLENIYISRFYDVFNAANQEQKECILELVSDERLEVFLTYSPDCVQQLVDFLKFETYDEEEMGIFERISKMSPKVIANFLEEADEPKIIYQIFKLVDEKAIVSICQHITNLYWLMEKSDFRLLNYADQIPIWNLNEEEWRNFYNSLTQKEIDLRTIPIKCLIQMYCSGNQEVKEKILYDVLEREEMADLYYELCLEDQMEMLDFMSGKKVSQTYETEMKMYMLENAVGILNKKKDRNSMEDMYLKNLKKKLS